MLVQTGILCVPTYDEAAVDAVRRTLAGQTQAEASSGAGSSPHRFVVVQDRHASMQRNVVEDLLCRWCDDEELDLIVTIGGTQPAPGPSSREIVPEATVAVGERALPGLGEAMRRAAAAVTPLALLDRSQAVIRGRTLILNLPAGSQAATLFLAAIAPVLLPLLGQLQEQPAPMSLDEVVAAAQQAGHEIATEDEPQRTGPGMQAGSIASEAGKKALDAAEFEAFLKRRSPPQSP